MLIKNSILASINSIKCSDMELYLNATSSVRLSKIQCPCCHSTGQCTAIGPYNRTMISVTKGSRSEQTLSVKRFICNSCRHTHALLPDILIPYGSYSIRFILTVLVLYLHRKTSVADFCDKWHISVSTLYSWISLFIRHYSAFHSSLDHIRSLSAKPVNRVRHADNFISDFFNRFRFHFLQLKTTSCYHPHPPADSFPDGMT